MKLSINLTHLRATLSALLIAALALVVPQTVYAQVTADWTNLGKANFEEVVDGDSVTVGSNQVTINTQVVLDGDANDANFGQFYSTGPLSYFNGQISSFTGVLLYDIDSSIFDQGDFFESTYTFDTAVNDLNFTVGHVDQFFDATRGMHDALVIEYDTGDGVWRNLRNLGGSFALGSVVGTTTINGQLGFQGTAPNGGLTATNGDIAVDFGSTTVERFRIRYHFGQANPTRDPTADIQYVALSDLTFAAPGADLSLTKQLVGSPPLNGGSASWRLIVTNAATSTLSANSIVVNDTLPGSFSFTSASGDGSFNAATGDWTVGQTLAPGQSATITIQGTISAAAGTVITNSAEITASSALDPDSIVNNGVATEDDFDTSTFTVQSGRAPGTPPLLACPASESIFDWDNISGWVNGSTNNTYAFSTFGNVNFSISNDGAFLNNAVFGGQSPTVFNEFTGGNLPAEDSLTLVADQSSQAGEVEVVIALPRSFDGLQFTIFDVDFNAGQFADRVEVVGTLGGANVTPTLTNGNVNFVVGNEAFGDGASASDQAFGNVVVTFTDPVDTVFVRYGNHSTAPVDPGQQGIGIHDITVCDPFTTMSITKFSSVLSDPVNGSSSPKAIPGALIEYLITVSNTGSEVTDPDSIVVLDDGPADAKLCLISAASGPVNYSGTGTGLTYNFASIGSTTDDLEFSNNNGTTFNYTPVADGDGCDTAVTDFRLSPSGAMNGGTSFTLRVRYVVE